MECYCSVRNIQLADGQTLCKTQFNSPIDGPIIYFWRRNNILSCFCERPESSASVRPKSPSWNIHGLRLERVDRFKADTEDLKTLPQSEIHVIRFKSKEVDIQKRDHEFAFPCRTGEMLQEEQSSSTVVYQAVGDIWQECQEKPSEADREARDPSPDLEASTKLKDYKRRVPITE